MSGNNDGPSQDLKTPLTDSDHGLIAAETIVQTPARPPIVYSSPKAFARSFAARWKSIWTRAFILSLLAGQVASLCITCTNITTTELVNRGWTLSTTQGIFLYFCLFLIYTPYTIYKYGIKGWANVILRDGWKYAILAACDFEANFLAVKAYQYTDLLSVMLLDAWAIPSCLFFCWLYLRTKYHWTQLFGVFVCVAGLGLLVASDELTKKDYAPVSRAKGDCFIIAAATIYGFSEYSTLFLGSLISSNKLANATEEFFVRKRPLYEVVGQLGMWGFLFNGIQSSALEWKQIKEVPWNGATLGLLAAYTCSLIILYTVSPLLYRSASSAYFNLSLLSSDFYGLFFGLFLYHYRPFWLYFVAFAVVIAGLITYFWSATPEEQGFLDPQAPDYVHRTPSGAALPDRVQTNA